MGNVYGKPVKPVSVTKPPTTFEAIQKLHKQVDTINLSIKQKSLMCETYYGKAKQCLSSGQKEDAKLFLEKKALLEKRVTQLLKMVTTLEQQILALESSSMNNDVAKAIAVSNEAMKGTNLDSDKVVNLMDNIREQMDTTNDVANILSEPLGDTVDVTDELEKMMPQVEILPMPVVPNIKHVAPAQTPIEEEIRKLELAS